MPFSVWLPVFCSVATVRFGLVVSLPTSPKFSVAAVDVSVAMAPFGEPVPVSGTSVSVAGLGLPPELLVNRRFPVLAPGPSSAGTGR